MNHLALLPALSCAVLAASSSAATAQAGTGGFKAGDLYLYSAALDALSGGGGIVHVDPVTGATDFMFDLLTSVSGQGPICYEPFRDRLLFYGGFQNDHTELYASDAAGNLVSLGFPGAGGSAFVQMAPRGDGIVYLRYFNTPAGGISYLDPTDQIRTLKDASGLNNYSGPVVYAMHYEVPSGSLVLGSYSNTSVCPSEVVDSVNIFVLQLSADGSRVLGESCFTYEVAPGTQIEVPVGVSQGPGGDLILTVDTNSSSGDARIARLDLGNLSASVYATNDYTGDAVVASGLYSHVLGKVVLLDPFNDVLRAYSEGEVGGGSIIASSGLSLPGATSEKATLTEVVHATPLYGLSTTSGTVSLSAGGSQPLSLELDAARAGELYLILGSASGWTPGLAGGGPLLPLNLDSYLLYTLFHPNTLPLAGSLGFLDGAGSATATFSLPAGTDPGLAGAVLHHAATALDGSFAATQTTNPVPVVLVP